MEISELELARREEFSKSKSDKDALELNDLQLTLIGGGGGDVIFF